MTTQILSLWIAAKTRMDDDRGASLVEYALLVALIAIVCVGAVSLLGGAVQEPYSDLSSQLG